MSFRRNRDVGRTSTALFATAVVVVGGTLACGFIVLLFAPNPRELVKWVVGVCAGLIVLSWLLRTRPSTGLTKEKMLWILQKNQKQDAPIYIPERREPTPDIVHIQEEVVQPPTVEQIRELKIENKAQNWAPSTESMQYVAAQKARESQAAHVKGKPRHRKS